MNMAENIRRFGRYFLTGGFAAVVDYALFLVLVQIIPSVFVAAFVSTAIALAVNYVLAARFTFRIKGTPARAWLFTIGAIIGININAGSTALAENLELVGPGTAKVFGTGVAFIFNFLFNNFVVFPQQAASKQCFAQQFPTKH